MIDEKIIAKNEIKEFSPVVLAFVGDSVHTLFIRDYIIKKKDLNVGNFHLLASKYCKAEAQKNVFDKIFHELTDDEKEIALRARNHRIKSVKNASPEDYKKATAFEAVIGYLYLTGNKNRLKEILYKSLN